MLHSSNSFRNVFEMKTESASEEKVSTATLSAFPHSRNSFINLGASDFRIANPGNIRLESLQVIARNQQNPARLCLRGPLRSATTRLKGSSIESSSRFRGADRCIVCLGLLAKQAGQLQFCQSPEEKFIPVTQAAVAFKLLMPPHPVL